VRKKFQAKHIKDTEIVAVIDHIDALKLKTARWEIQTQFPQFPAKVVNAKLRAATLKGFLAGCAKDGCTCSDAYIVIKRPEA
jgi:hypothetical protein